MSYLKRIQTLADDAAKPKKSAIKNRWQKFAEEYGDNIDMAGNFNFNEYLWSFEPNYPLSKFLPETLKVAKKMYLKDKKDAADDTTPRYTDQWEKEVILEKRPLAVLVEFRNKVYDIDEGGGILDGNHRLGLFGLLKKKTIPAVVGRPKNPTLFYWEWVDPTRHDNDKSNPLSYYLADGNKDTDIICVAPWTQNITGQSVGILRRSIMSRWVGKNFEDNKYTDFDDFSKAVGLILDGKILKKIGAPTDISSFDDNRWSADSPNTRARLADFVGENPKYHVVTQFDDKSWIAWINHIDKAYLT